MPERLVAHRAEHVLVGEGPAADERERPFRPTSLNCLAKRSASAPEKTA